jgi:hypothetical protein
LVFRAILLYPCCWSFLWSRIVRYVLFLFIIDSMFLKLLVMWLVFVVQ